MVDVSLFSVECEEILQTVNMYANVKKTTTRYGKGLPDHLNTLERTLCVSNRLNLYWMDPGLVMSDRCMQTAARWSHGKCSTTSRPKLKNPWAYGRYQRGKQKKTIA